jgi:uncharacterized protein
MSDAALWFYGWPLGALIDFTDFSTCYAAMSPPRSEPTGSPSRPNAAPTRLTVDPRAAAREGRSLQGHFPAAGLDRLQESVADVARLAGQPVPVQEQGVAWSADFELRVHATDERRQRQDIWLHLVAQTQVPLVCQRCLSLYLEPLEVDRWFRFVNDEATADAEDDSAEEDLLVLDPRFDLGSLVEDELLLAMPLIPMHAQCPEPIVAAQDEGGASAQASAQAGAQGGAQGGAQAGAQDRPNPFAVLQALQTKRG